MRQEITMVALNLKLLRKTKPLASHWKNKDIMNVNVYKHLQGKD